MGRSGGGFGLCMRQGNPSVAQRYRSAPSVPKVIASAPEELTGSMATAFASEKQARTPDNGRLRAVAAQPPPICWAHSKLQKTASTVAPDQPSNRMGRLLDPSTVSRSKGQESERPEHKSACRHGGGGGASGRLLHRAGDGAGCRASGVGQSLVDLGSRLGDGLIHFCGGLGGQVADGGGVGGGDDGAIGVEVGAAGAGVEAVGGVR